MRRNRIRIHVIVNLRIRIPSSAQLIRQLPMLPVGGNMFADYVDDVRHVILTVGQQCCKIN